MARTRIAILSLANLKKNVTFNETMFPINTVLFYIKIQHSYKSFLYSLSL